MISGPRTTASAGPLTASVVRIPATPQPVTAFANLSFLLFETGLPLNRAVTVASHHSGFVPEITVRSVQAEFLFGLIAAGLETGFLPRMMLETRRHDGIRAIALDDPDMLWHMTLAWRHGGYLSDTVRA
ncbi:LysR substrate-binding domain-containing protein [Komagataeibacter swingsii]|uniref:LysR substrate-binding domain-containing protein n=1 Tax=Komagataeibacter swingsii TaxID=215220 RepID=A0A850P8Z6_9PROT|nr:LysR substrate-binding domain-containing protein [Komagataeibacter swingsii]NVN38352.1 hypothetical protein [Komagataeibacter swingsii]